MAIDTIPNISLRPGFGEYPLSKGKTFAQMQTAAKLNRIALAVLLGVVAICSVAIAAVSITWAVSSAMVASFMMIKQIISTFGVANRAPPTNELFPAEKVALLPALGSACSIPCSGIPTKDGPDSLSWKEELIRSARKSIVLSGCYCGGRVFDSTLDLIKTQMETYPELTCSILSSDVYITEENQTRIMALKEQFDARFSCVVSPELFPYSSPVTGDFSISSNHTKVLVIDYGSYFMVGGTGLVSSFAEQKGVSEPENIEPKSSWFETAVDSLFKMRAFRDMDFVFRSEINGIGTKIYVEMSKLIERMRHLQVKEMHVPNSDWPVAAERTCSRFENMETRQDDLRVSCYTSGPESEGNLFFEEMIAEIDAATTSIVIDHLYFQPPERLFDALVRASNRNVQITVLTNKNGSKSPGSHALYTERSRYYARSLFEGRPKANIELFEYDVPYTSLHKKLVVIDGKKCLLGSANMGKKSLENLDYEINLKIDSEGFAEEVIKSIEEDKEICIRVPDEEAYKTSLMMDILAPIQSISMNII